MPTMSRFFPAASVPVLRVFCPFVVGYFISFIFRNVTAVIAKEPGAEFALTSADLGFLTSMYLFAFAAAQLPLGLLLDRYGPRRTVAALLCVAVVGALVFALARDLASLAVGRALIGLGVSAGLMGAIKAFTLWFPLSRLATLNGVYLAVGGLGALAATSPAEALAGALGWRGVFVVLSVLALGAAVLVFKVGLSISIAMLGLIAAGVQAGVGVILAVYTFTGVSASLAYALLTPLFPPEMTGRVSTVANVLIFTLGFAIQWAVGAALRLYPVVDGRYAPAGYAAAFATLVALQLLALAWLWPMRQPRL